MIFIHHIQGGKLLTFLIVSTHFACNPCVKLRWSIKFKLIYSHWFQWNGTDSSQVFWLPCFVTEISWCRKSNQGRISKGSWLLATSWLDLQSDCREVFASSCFLLVRNMALWDAGSVRHIWLWMGSTRLDDMNGSRLSLTLCWGDFVTTWPWFWSSGKHDSSSTL